MIDMLYVYVLESCLAVLCKVTQGRASGMDCTLHTDLRESETSRDIKK